MLTNYYIYCLLLAYLLANVNKYNFIVKCYQSFIKTLNKAVKVILIWCFVLRFSIWWSCMFGLVLLHCIGLLQGSILNIITFIKSLQISRMRAVRRSTLLCHLLILRVIVCLARWRIVLHWYRQAIYFYKVYLALKAFLGPCLSFFLLCAA